MIQIPLDGRKINDLFIETEMDTFDKVAEFLNVSPRTLYSWISKNAIPQKHFKKLTDLIEEKKNAKLKYALDRAEIGMLIRAIEKRGYTVSLESK